MSNAFNRTDNGIGDPLIKWKLPCLRSFYTCETVHPRGPLRMAPNTFFRTLIAYYALFPPNFVNGLQCQGASNMYKCIYYTTLEIHIFFLSAAACDFSFHRHLEIIMSWERFFFLFYILLTGDDQTRQKYPWVNGLSVESCTEPFWWTLFERTSFYGSRMWVYERTVQSWLQRPWSWMKRRNYVFFCLEEKVPVSTR